MQASSKPDALFLFIVYIVFTFSVLACFSFTFFKKFRARLRLVRYPPFSRRFISPQVVAPFPFSSHPLIRKADQIFPVFGGQVVCQPSQLFNDYVRDRSSSPISLRSKRFRCYAGYSPIGFPSLLSSSVCPASKVKKKHKIS